MHLGKRPERHEEKELKAGFHVTGSSIKENSTPNPSVGGGSVLRFSRRLGSKPWSKGKQTRDENSGGASH